MTDNKLQKVGGIAAISEGLIYIIAFVIYGGILVYPNTNANSNERLTFLSDNHLILASTTFISYVLFGILLVVLTLAVYHRLKAVAPTLSQLTALFGFIWSVLVIASGMIENIGLASVIKMGAKNPEKAMDVFSSVSIITEGLGGGNEIVGGIWVLLLSITALKARIFSKALHVLGLFIGLIGILTTYPLPIFTEIFGLGQIVWFIWLGGALFRRQNEI